MTQLLPRWISPIRTIQGTQVDRGPAITLESKGQLDLIARLKGMVANIPERVAALISLLICYPTCRSFKFGKYKSLGTYCEMENEC